MSINKKKLNVEKIENEIKFYTLFTKLKDTIRTGPIIWNANRERIESFKRKRIGVEFYESLYILR